MNFDGIVIIKIVMNIKVGDKIRFLNNVGGGVVRGFTGKDKVLIEDEDGFEVPCFIRECVVISDNISPTHNISMPKPATQSSVAVSKPEPREVKVLETPEGERLNIDLAFLPIDPKAFQQTGYETYFINSSNYYLFFNYMSRENNSWTSRYNGTIEPNTKIFLEEFGKEDLNSLERICIQLIAFKKDKPFNMKNAVSVELRPDIVKFYKAHCFMENDFFDEDALILSVVKDDIPERELLISAAELQSAMMQKVKADKTTAQTTPKKSNPLNAPLEIDLHASELLETTAGMNNADILTYQIDKFNEILKQYGAKKGQKIVFIHGKGDGVLRKAIEKELKTKYKSYYFQDASFREYGFGATMVTIK